MDTEVPERDDAAARAVDHDALAEERRGERLSRRYLFGERYGIPERPQRFVHGSQGSCPSLRIADRLRDVPAHGRKIDL